MSKTFNTRILTPDGTLFEGEVFGLQVPGANGSFEMKAGHAPIISSLEIGSLRIQTPDGQLHYYAVSGGFVEMVENQATVMAEAAESINDIDEERARQALARAWEALRAQKGKRDVMERALKRAENRLKLIQKYA